jgi:hypothetical protein
MRIDLAKRIALMAFLARSFGQYKAPTKVRRAGGHKSFTALQEEAGCLVASVGCPRQRRCVLHD